MDKTFNFSAILPLILLMLLAAGGFYYWHTEGNSDKTTSAPTSSGGVILGDTSQSKTDKITDGQVYANKISEIRPPINKGFEDLASKAKYSTLFNSEEIQKIINDTRQKIEEGIKTLQDLHLDPKFKDTNAQEIKSLNLLLEAINSFEKARVETDKKEAQRLSELYSYDIEQSNKILKEIQIPK